MFVGFHFSIFGGLLELVAKNQMYIYICNGHGKVAKTMGPNWVWMTNWTAKQILKSRGMFSCGNSIPQHGINLSQSTFNRRVKQPNIECNCRRAGQFPSTMLLFMLVILINHGWTRPKNAELQNASGWQGFLTCRWLAVNWRPDTKYHEDPWSTHQKGFSRLNKTARIPWAWEGWR